MVELCTIPNSITATCFLAMIFLALISALSPPKSNGVSFLSATIEVISNTGIEFIPVSFGVFGYTGSKASIGYHMPPYFPSKRYHVLTYFLVLYPIGACLFGFAFLSRLVRRTTHTVSVVFIMLASFCTVTAWICSSTLFGLMSNKLTKDGSSFQLGNATWLGIGVLCAVVLPTVAAMHQLCCTPSWTSSAMDEENAPVQPSGVDNWVGQGTFDDHSIAMTDSMPFYVAEVTEYARNLSGR